MRHKCQVNLTHQSFGVQPRKQAHTVFTNILAYSVTLPKTATQRLSLLLYKHLTDSYFSPIMLLCSLNAITCTQDSNEQMGLLCAAVPSVHTDKRGKFACIFTDHCAWTNCLAGLSHAGAALAAGRSGSHFPPCLPRCGLPPWCCPCPLCLLHTLQPSAAPPV